jgi:hypothetical protein
MLIIVEAVKKSKTWGYATILEIFIRDVYPSIIDDS